MEGNLYDSTSQIDISKVGTMCAKKKKMLQSRADLHFFNSSSQFFSPQKIHISIYLNKLSIFLLARYVFTNNSTI